MPASSTTDMNSLRNDVCSSLTGEDIAGAEAVGRFRFPAEQQVFSGHFPGYPLVPGVFLLETARIVSERIAGKKLRLTGIENAKFTREVRPGDTVETAVTLREEGGHWSCRATARTKDGPAARIRLRLVETGGGS